MEEVAKKSKGIVVGAWLTIILSLVIVVGAVCMFVFLYDELELFYLIWFAVFALVLIGFIPYYIILLIKYYRSPKTLIAREGEMIKFYDEKRGLVTIAAKEVSSVFISGKFMKASLLNIIRNKAEGDLLINVGAVQYKVLNLKDADGAREKLWRIVEDAKIKASLNLQ